MRDRLKPIGWPLAVALTASTIGAMPAAAPAQTGAQNAGRSAVTVQIATNRGRLVTLARPMSDLFVANPDVADVQVRSPTQLYIFGKKAGETTISATSKSGAVVYSSTVRVGNNYDSLGQMLALAMPDAHINAMPMNGLVLLTGTVGAPDDSAEAERLVQAFVGGDVKVVSRLQTATPLQVNLQVRIAEVSRSFVKNIGVNFATRDQTSGFNFGVGSGRQPGSYTAADLARYPTATLPVKGGGSITGPYDPTTGQFINPGSTSVANVSKTASFTTLGLAGHLLGLDVLSAIDLGETIGQVSTLANPNLTALSGETATFLVGGEFPIPISQALGTVSVEFKQYGISLAYTPTVLSNGRISLRVRPEVSQLTSDGAIQINGTTIPALSTRRAETTLVLGSGESMVIGGLLQNTHNNSIDKAPGLGDLPVLGALFRSNGWRRNETELMIVITPYLVKPVNANEIVLPTDGEQAPTDLGRIVMGRLGGGISGAKRPVPTMAPAAPVAPSVGANAPVLPAPRFDPEPVPVDTKAKRKKGDAPNPGFSNN